MFVLFVPIVSIVLWGGEPPVYAFWLLGFSTADTVPAGHVGFITGTGGQLTDVGHPKEASFTPFLTHAGLRLGLTDRVDIGYRLTQVALPFTSVGPTLGGEVDLKLRLMDLADMWQAALVIGGAYSFLQISGQSESAWSPGMDLMISRELGPGLWLITELRYVYTAIPTGPGGVAQNYLNAVGPDLGFKIAFTPQVSLVPEIGLFDFIGRLERRNASGLGFQYGAVLSVSNARSLVVCGLSRGGS